MKEFPCLGSLIANSGWMDVDVERNQASKTFGAVAILGHPSGGLSKSAS